MELLKTNKSSNLIEKRVGGSVTILNVKEDSYKGREVSHLTILNDGEVQSITCGGHGYKAGPATICQTLWSKDSKFGANVSTKVTNID